MQNEILQNLAKFEVQREEYKMSSDGKALITKSGVVSRPSNSTQNSIDAAGKTHLGTFSK